ncbi:MAG: hypothetical protein ACRC0X_01490, partial [Brevinema sp.]
VSFYCVLHLLYMDKMTIKLLELELERNHKYKEKTLDIIITQHNALWDLSLRDKSYLGDLIDGDRSSNTGSLGICQPQG